MTLKTDLRRLPFNFLQNFLRFIAERFQGAVASRFPVRRGTPAEVHESVDEEFEDLDFENEPEGDYSIDFDIAYEVADDEGVHAEFDSEEYDTSDDFEEDASHELEIEHEHEYAHAEADEYETDRAHAQEATEHAHDGEHAPESSDDVPHDREDFDFEWQFEGDGARTMAAAGADVVGRDVPVSPGGADPAAALNGAHASTLGAGDIQALVDLARRKAQVGDEALTRRICTRLSELEGLDESICNEAQAILFRMTVRACHGDRAAIEESILLQDETSVREAIGRQIERTQALHEVDTAIEDDRWVPIVLAYNHAIATRALLLWKQGAVPEAETELNFEKSALDRHAISIEQRWDLYTQFVAENGRIAFEHRRWEDAAEVFRYARSKRLAAFRNTIDDTTAEMYVREAMCEYNEQRYARAKEVLTHLIRRAPQYRATELRELRDRAHRAEIAVHSREMVRRAALAFDLRDWDSAGVFYRQAADYLESHQEEEFRTIAAECYYNAAMSRWNHGNFRECRSILHYLRRAYAEYESDAVEARLLQLERAFAAEAPRTGPGPDESS